MNQIEIDRSLRKLRLSGMASTLETRILHAQTERLAHLDFLSLLVNDELLPLEVGEERQPTGVREQGRIGRHRPRTLLGAPNRTEYGAVWPR